MQDMFVISLDQSPIKPIQIRVDFFQVFPFKFDIVWFVLWSLTQKAVLNILPTYVEVLTLGTHNPCSRRYLIHMPL